ncbi:MAG: hypothetical protein IT336_07975, partial [Thermomicrobiales bacterium]|nr:hypothetical protein [Thermomicrobiales bacterium]
PLPDRVLATLLLTEIVDAAETAVRLGDAGWRRVLTGYDEIVREQVARFRGRSVGSVVNGVLTAFDGPARAILCAHAIVDGARRLGLGVRAGLHTGECEAVGDSLTGVALQIAARAAARARTGEILVTSTVRDLVAGSGIAFEDASAHLMTGDGGIWRLHRVSGGPDGLGWSGPAASSETARSERGVERLSPREREVAALVARGGANRAIAEELFISAATVERHVANIMTKLGCRSRAQIAAWAVEHGLLHDRAE